MGAISLPYVRCQRSKGRPYYYYRRNGRDVRLPDPTDPGFLPTYQTVHAAAETAAGAVKAAGPAAPAPGSMAALVVAYKGSPEWRELAPATQKDYQKVLEPLRTRFGHLPVATLPREFVFKLRDEYARKSVTDKDGKQVTLETPRRANRVVAVLRLLLEWGVNRGWRKDNPALRPGKLRTGPGYATWTADQFRQFMACEAVGEPIKRAAALAWFTGMRGQDCIAITKAARKDGGIDVIPEKTRNSTGVRVWIPEHPDLTRVLDAAPQSDAVTVLTRPDGKPWRLDHFRHEFGDAVKAAGLDGLSFHGLRYGATAQLAEAGASDAEIEAIVPHADGKMTRKYRAQAAQKTLAKAAMGKRSGERLSHEP